jgi:arylsulfatase A-like enzyme
LLLWVHYVEPHAPYRLHEEFVERLGIPEKNPSRRDRYDSEIADVDRAVAEFLEGLEALDPEGDRLIVFASDHGESLGEHDYWGHGRNLYEPTLRIPMAIVWPGRIEPGTIEAPSLIIDLAPTVAGLLGLRQPAGFAGYDWTGVLRGGPPPEGRITVHQAHRGAVLSKHDSDVARRAGLLEVALIHDGRKEIFRVKNGRRREFDLREDPLEIVDLAPGRPEPTAELEEWMRLVSTGLTEADSLPATTLDEETIEQLRALGYAE